MLQSLVREAKKYSKDWIVTIVIACVFIVYLELAPAYLRDFKLNDSTIQHSFTTHQIITDIRLYFLVFLIPVAVMAITVFSKYRYNMYQMSHLVHVSFLSMLMAFVLTGFITDVLKIWISRPRPDFLARCVPLPNTPVDVYVNIDSCSQTNKFILNDGFKSCPSGHSSLSMCGCLFLCLWLNGQFKLFDRTKPIHLQLLSWSYILMALFIAISRSLDYRHHVEDIMFGLLIGGGCAYTIYFKYFPGLSDEECNLPRENNSDILPS